MVRRYRPRSAKPNAPSPVQFFSRLRWLDGRPLLATIEPYRQELFTRALFEFRDDGSPLHNLVLAGRGKKNFKSADLVLAALYCLLLRKSHHGNDCFILANDEGQAADDLLLAKRLIEANSDELRGELELLKAEIKRTDNRGSLKILPARDVAGAHGKTALFLGFDEIHGYRDWGLLEALQPDPTRTDSLVWITSYDTIFNAPGVPLHDLKQIGRTGADPRMLFSWYSGGELCTDPAAASLPPEERANPSMGAWPEGAAYLEQQRRRLPTHKFRRLHLNLPGAPDGAFLDADVVLRAVVRGRRSLAPEQDQSYKAFVDMAGGSHDDACLAIAHKHEARTVVDWVGRQPGPVPFNPRVAVTHFVEKLREYGLGAVTGDNYAGDTFKADFANNGITYMASPKSKTQLYEALEPRLNAHEVDLPEVPKLIEQLLTLVMRGSKIDHQPGDHDDWANAVAGVVDLVAAPERVLNGLSKESLVIVRAYV